MAVQHLYWYAQDIALTAGQRQTLVQQLRALMADPDDPQPCRRNHFRPNLAGDTVIFEAAVDTDHLTAVSVRNRLAALFGVAQTSITYTTTQTAYGPALTYKHNTTNRVRFGVFGGLEASRGESLAAVTAYLADNRAAWETEG